MIGVAGKGLGMDTQAFLETPRGLRHGAFARLLSWRLACITLAIIKLDCPGDQSLMSVDRDTVRRIATLARIRVKEEELDQLAGELSSILNWIEMLNEVDTEGVEPMTSVEQMEMKKRDDVVTDGFCPDDVLANAPRREGNFFAVPKVVE